MNFGSQARRLGNFGTVSDKVGHEQVATGTAALTSNAFDPAFWSGKKVLVTGHTGFKGSWLTLMLDQLGAKVGGIALPPLIDRPCLFDLCGIDHICHSVYVDINSPEDVTKQLVEFQPEIVFHLAAQALVKASYDAPVYTFSTNVLGTVHLLEACRHAGAVRTIVNVTSDKCYENQNLQRGYAEADRLGGHDPYSNSKACSELVTASYRDSFLRSSGIGVATARAGNVIGGGDWSSNRIIPDVIRTLSGEMSLELRNPNSIRPWQHVFEPLSGYLLLARRLHERPTSAEGAWNFGPEASSEQTVASVVEKAFAAWGSKNKWEFDSRPHQTETSLLRLDSTKAKQLLGWKPRWDLDEALNQTMAWYKRPPTRRKPF